LHPTFTTPILIIPFQTAHGIAHVDGIGAAHAKETKT